MKNKAEDILLGHIANRKRIRNDVALDYACAMGSGQEINWRKVNEAIIERWSFSALEYIKARARKWMKPEISWILDFARGKEG